MLLFEVNGQTLKRTDHFDPATDSVEYLKAKFTFKGTDWNGKAKTALFRLGTTVYSAVLNSSNTCVVPWEVLVGSMNQSYRMHGHKIHVSLVGEYGTMRITTGEVAVKLASSGYGDMETPADPTETVYQQLLTNYADALTQTEAARAELATAKNIFANAIKGNLSGAVVAADDVSPVEHSPVVKIHGKNLFNYAAWKGITIRNGTATFTDAGAVTLTANANDCYTLYSESDFPESVRIKVTPGEQITLSWDVDDADASGSVYIFPNGATADFGMAWSAQKMLVYTVPRGCEFITFRLGVAYAGDTITYRNIQLERGSTATAYEAYIAPTAVTVSRYGKNLCPSIAVGKSGTTGGVTFTGLKGGGVGVSGTPTDLGRYSLYNGVALAKAGYITLSLSGNFTNIVWDFQLKDADKTIIKQIQTGTSATLNLDDYPDTVYWDIGIKRQTNGVVCGGTVYVQVEVGLTATDFEAYQSPTTHTPESDGSVSDMTSLSPSMTILTDSDGAIVECEYIRDTNKVIDKIITALGGAI